jgi:hypothetical protein
MGDTMMDFALYQAETYTPQGSGFVFDPRLKPLRPLIKSYGSLLREYGADYTATQRLLEMQQHLMPMMAKAMGADLVKAMSAQSGLLGQPALGPANQLLLENLDPLMTSILFQMEHLKLINMLSRVPSKQIKFEWIRNTSYGVRRGSLGFREGGAPNGGSSAFTRGDMNVKFLGTRRGVTWQMMMSGEMGGTFIDPEQKEQMDGTMELLGGVERMLVWGDKGILDKDSNETNYHGFWKQLLGATQPTSVHGDVSVIDKKGQPLDPEDFETYAAQFRTRGKLPSLANVRTLWSPLVLTDLGKIVRQGERRDLGQGLPGGFVIGTPIVGYMTQFGFLPFDDSIMLEQVDSSIPLAASENGAPTAPSAATPSAGAVSGAEVSFMDAGTYQYALSAFNDVGESTATQLAAAQAVTVGQKVTLTFPSAPSGATGWRVYRQDVGAATYDRTKAFIVASLPIASTTFVDFNQLRPNTGMGLLINTDREDVVVPQLAPLTKWPLGLVNTTKEFLLMLAHALTVKAQERVIFVKNIGPRS